jgi:S1-C subfamily serine protease
VLQNALGKYASKNDQEDQAETARYFMTNLADALVQTVESPKLPGSQRILHGLQLYREAGSPGPGIDWFVDLSLKRAPRATISTNPYLEKVDKAINDPDARAAIRRVQPACVRLSNGSGCCVSRKGQILTAAHVAGQIGQLLKVTFPDGQSHWAKCSALDAHLDLALLQINDNGDYPFAPAAHAPPEADTWVCVIGQPGSTTPSGRATNYQPFHVSVGKIRGFKEDDRLALQTLGGTKHDAWTYWGHSGSPLFNKQGEIVAMHNSWDSTTAMRHAVTYEAIVKFLRDSGVNTVASR